MSESEVEVVTDTQPWDEDLVPYLQQQITWALEEIARLEDRVVSLQEQLDQYTSTTP